MPGSSVQRDDLEHYLGTPPEANVTDPMGWWYERQDFYRRLHRMGLDYLSIPRKYARLSP